MIGSARYLKSFFAAKSRRDLIVEIERLRAENTALQERIGNMRTQYRRVIAALEPVMKKNILADTTTGVVGLLHPPVHHSRRAFNTSIEGLNPCEQ
jgi:hypothetical protein